MHVGGAIQGLQHVVYDPPAPPVAPSPPAVAPVGAKASTGDNSRDDGDPYSRGYNPVTDLIERLSATRPAEPPTAPESAFSPASPETSSIDLSA